MVSKPTLQGERVMLRPILAGDLDAYFALLEDRESLRLTGTHATFSRENAAQWIEAIANRDDRVDLAIIVRESNILVGEVVINDIDQNNRSANIRIGILTAHTNRGYGREALQLMIRYGFEQLKLHRLELSVYAFNERAIHVYEQLGFQREGRRRDAILLDGVYHDAFDMSILEYEYVAAQASK